MSMYYREHDERYYPTFTGGRTKQSFKDSCDVNKILAKAQKAGTLSHLEKYKGTYGDFSDFDFMEAQLALAKGKEIFAELPSEVRKDFGQDPARFFAFVNDPANAERLKELLPAIAEPGRYFPNPVNQGANSGAAGARTSQSADTAVSGASEEVTSAPSTGSAEAGSGGSDT